MSVGMHAASGRSTIAMGGEKLPYMPHIQVSLASETGAGAGEGNSSTLETPKKQKKNGKKRGSSAKGKGNNKGGKGSTTNIEAPSSGMKKMKSRRKTHLHQNHLVASALTGVHKKTQKQQMTKAAIADAKSAQKGRQQKKQLHTVRKRLNQNQNQVKGGRDSGGRNSTTGGGARGRIMPAPNNNNRVNGGKQLDMGHGMRLTMHGGPSSPLPSSHMNTTMSSTGSMASPKRK